MSHETYMAFYLLFELSLLADLSAILDHFGKFGDFLTNLILEKCEHCTKNLYQIL